MDGYLVKGSVAIPRGSLLRIDEGAGMLAGVVAPQHAARTN